MNDPKQLIAYPADFVQAIANYLAERPFKEVAAFIDGIQRNGMPVTIPPPEAPKEAPKEAP